MKGLLLTLFGVIFCAFILLGSRGLVSAVAPRSSDAQNTLRIGAFNIQVFGVSKLERAGVLPVLVDVSLTHCVFILAIDFVVSERTETHLIL